MNISESRARFNEAGTLPKQDLNWFTFYKKYESTILPLILLIVFLIMWEVIPSLGLVKPLFTSSPTRIFRAAQWLLVNGLWHDILVSGAEFWAGFILAIVLGIPLGICLGWYRRLQLMLDPFVSALYTIPRVALLPLLILWLGIGIESKIAVVFLGAFFPILVNIMAGMRTIDESLLKCAQAFGANDRQIFITLALPSVVPFIIAGIRLGVGRGLVGIVVGELVASTAGIGHMMSVAGATFQTDKVFVGIILLVGFGLLLAELLKRIEARFETWRPERNS